MFTLTNNQIVDELKRITPQSGVLSREDVLMAATPASHPLHSFFEWNNDKAGHEYRLIQAGKLLTVKVSQVVVPTTGEKRVVPFGVSLGNQRAKGGGYQTLQSVLASPPDEKQMAIDVLKRCAGDLRNHPSHHTADILAFIEARLTQLLPPAPVKTMVAAPKRRQLAVSPPTP